jgi:hypothetical protein
MSSYPTLDYSEQALNDPRCPTCGEKATARLGNWPGREAAEFWDSIAHVWFVRLAARVAAPREPK